MMHFNIIKCREVVEGNLILQFYVENEILLKLKLEILIRFRCMYGHKDFRFKFFF